MFCRHCGESNKDHHNYCSRDGVLLYKKKQQARLVKTKAKFCKTCGQGTEAYDIYCGKCGTSLYEKKKKEGFIEVGDIKETINFKDTNSRGQALNLKNSFFYAMTGFGIIFLISIMISSFVNVAFKDEMMRSLGMPMDIKILQIWDLALLSNMTNINLIISSGAYGGMSGTAGLSGIPFVFLLVPFIVFVLLGIYKGKTNNKGARSFDIRGTLIMGAFYGLTLSILSLIASSKMEIMLPYVGNIIMQKKYLILTGLINGTMISIISFMIGYAIYWKISKNDNLVKGFEWLFDGLFIFLIIAVIVSMITGFYIKFIVKDPSDNFLLDLAAISQVGIYAFLMINFGSFVFNAGYPSYPGESVSIFKNTDMIKDMFDGKEMIFLYLGVLLIIVLFFLYGKGSKERANKNIIYTTLVYSLAVGLVSYLTYINISGYGGGQEYMGIFDDFFSQNMSVGFKLVYSIVGSFILSTSSMFAGYFISSGGKSQVKSY